jgi:hypothetical protein
VLSHLHVFLSTQQHSTVIIAITVEQAERNERNRQIALDRAAVYRREQREDGRAATGVAEDTVADAAASADGETRGGRKIGEDGSETLDKEESPDAGYNGMTDTPEPGNDDDAIAKEMLCDLHAIDKGLNDCRFPAEHRAPPRCFRGRGAVSGVRVWFFDPLL